MNQVPTRARRRLWVAGTTLTLVAAIVATIFSFQSPAVTTGVVGATIVLNTIAAARCRDRHEGRDRGPIAAITQKRRA